MPLAFTTGTSSHPKNTLQKRKFEFKVLLLLHILIPGVMLSSLETINPWLSACDLKQQSPSDLKGSCSATQFPTRTTPPPDVELLCPKECPPNESKTNDSCLAYLDDARRSAICNFNLGNGIEWLKSFLGTIRLRHCCEYKIIESLSQSLLERVLRGKDECFRIIDSLVDVDNLAARVTCEFSGILSRYDCEQPYSVKFSCNDCLYSNRLLSSLRERNRNWKRPQVNKEKKRSENFLLIARDE
ncbi:hypothetical protein RUM43_000931 [Polyplax serrata]|uniref:Uncharacterized protein n=1 Tax=Polyplax serrata TaxID=468196 RepID=A0AAN8XNU3_POLSC